MSERWVVVTVVPRSMYCKIWGLGGQTRHALSFAIFSVTMFLLSTSIFFFLCLFSSLWVSWNMVLFGSFVLLKVGYRLFFIITAFSSSIKSLTLLDDEPHNKDKIICQVRNQYVALGSNRLEEIMNATLYSHYMPSQTLIDQDDYRLVLRGIEEEDHARNVGTVVRV
ncbi:unnamed protein product [Prunus brigantina]